MKEIRIDVGVCTALTINLSNIDFSKIEKVIFTIKNSPVHNSPVIVEREFTEAKEHTIMITAEESIRLTSSAEYDFNMVLRENGERLKMTDNGKVVLRKGVGDCIDD